MIVLSVLSTHFIQGNDLLVVVFALIIGTILGDAIQLATKINNISSYLVECKYADRLCWQLLVTTAK